jgi:chromosome segregation ATPase
VQDAVEKLRQLHLDLYEVEIMLIEASSDLTILMERNRSVHDMLEAQRAELEVIVRQTEAASTEARRLLEICKNLMATDDPSLHNFFSTMPTGQSIEDLELEIESERGKLELMHEGNGGVIREYEQRQKKIDALQAQLADIRHGLAEFDEKIQEIRGRWEPELDGLVKKISDSFAFNMKQIHCAGEVGVYKDDDFDQWAIQIHVKFR